MKRVVSISPSISCPKCLAGYDKQAAIGVPHSTGRLLWHPVRCEACGLRYTQVWRSLSPQAWLRLQALARSLA